jgi:succinate dehydrogenase/fumarate reductase flavoprotein subunit
MDQRNCDVLVVGSGGAGLLAACVAADAGARVVVLERAPVFGGTTAVSGGMLWIPCNHLMAAAGQPDSRADALRYLGRVTEGTVEPWRLEQFVDLGPEVVRYLVERTPVRLFPIDRPDYHSEWPGAREGGRTLDNRPFDPGDRPGLDGLAQQVRAGRHFPPLTYAEKHRLRWPNQRDAAMRLVAERTAAGVRTMGGALAAALVAACADRGVELVAGVRARELLADGRAVGLRADTVDGPVAYRAAAGVILACGGFEWNARMKQAFLRGPEANPVSPPWNTGDGIVMASALGAALGNLTEAWWAPTVAVPGEWYDGAPMGRHIVDERSLPGSILVNRHGVRFVNEATNYNDLSKAFHTFDPGRYERPNVPAWLVFDAAFKRSYPVASIPPGDPAPPWFHCAATIEELAGAAGIRADALASTVLRFNEHARRGADPDFGRGRSAHDRYYGDERRPSSPCLAPLVEPPFYAVEIKPGSLGTKGGVVTDEQGRVLRYDGTPIEGLFACGNVAASVMAGGYPGSGATLGPALVGGYVSGAGASSR